MISNNIKIKIHLKYCFKLICKIVLKSYFFKKVEKRF